MSTVQRAQQPWWLSSRLKEGSTCKMSNGRITVENWSWYHYISVIRAHLASTTIALWTVQWLSSQKRNTVSSLHPCRQPAKLLLIRISFSEKDNSISESLPHGAQVSTSEQLLKLIYKVPEQGSLFSILKQVTGPICMHNFRAAVWKKMLTSGPWMRPILLSSFRQPLLNFQE